MSAQEIAALLSLPQDATLVEWADWWSVATARYVREICPPVVGRALRPAILQPDTWLRSIRRSSRP